MIHPRAPGFGLIEVMIGIVITAVLLMIGVPSMTQWVKNIQIRAVADSVQNGLQQARAEAVRRNAIVRFQLVDTMTSSCALSTAGQNWIISQDEVTAACDVAASDTVVPRVIEKRAAQEGGVAALVAGDLSSVCFNGIGRLVMTSAPSGCGMPAGDVNFNVSSAAGEACVAAGGPIRCLRVVLTTSGGVRMCDPAATGVRGC